MYEDDDAMDIIEEREREMKERKRLKAIKRKETESLQTASSLSKTTGKRGRPRTNRFDSDEDEADESDQDEEPAMTFGADSGNQRRSTKKPNAANTQEPDEPVAVDDAKIEAAMKKAVAAQKPRKQMPKMDVERLLSDKGLPKLLEMAEKFKVSDKASSLEKLNQLMALYELWCHVMFPKMAFTDVIRRLETLGTKRPVQSFMRKLRLGENPGPWDIHVDASDDENAAAGSARSVAGDNPLFEADNDNFDNFLSQALDQVEGGNSSANGKSGTVQQHDDDEDLDDLDAFLDNLNKPIRDDLL